MSGWQDSSPTHRATARGSHDVARGPGNGTFLSTPDSPSQFSRRVSHDLTFRLSRRTWSQVQEAGG